MMSRPPKLSVAVATKRSAKPSPVTEPTAVTALPPPVLMSRAVCSAGSASRSFTTTEAPSPASLSAISRPIPRPEPETMATLPSRCPMVCVLSGSVPGITDDDGGPQPRHRLAVTGDLGRADEEPQRPDLLRVDVGDLGAERQGVAGVRGGVVGELLLAVQDRARVDAQVGVEGGRRRALEVQAEQERRRHRQVTVPGPPRGVEIGVGRVGLTGRGGEGAQPATFHLRGVCRDPGTDRRGVQVGHRSRHQSSSRIVALAIPPASHIVCSPYRMPRSRMWCTNRVMRIAPDAPSGWPTAMAPPRGLSRSSVPPISACQASGTGAKASLTSYAPISEIRGPERLSTFSVAVIGAVIISTGSSPTTETLWIRAIGVRPCAAAVALEVI